MYIGSKVDGLIICGPRWKGQRPDGQNALYKLIHNMDQKAMDENPLDENHWDKTYIELNKMWTKNNGTKIIWTKLAWEQRVSGPKDFGRIIFGQKSIGPSWPRTEIIWTKSVWPNII